MSSGCSNKLATYPISAKVQFEGGNPVVVGVVELQSVDHKLNARGQIQEDGTVQFTTYSDKDGAVAGTHKCVVMQMIIQESASGYRPSTIGVVHPKHATYSSSGLEITVEPDGENNFVLVVDGVRKEQPEEGESHKH